jgi:vacuolar-type H+-ATPase subunit D/Vma8
LRLGIARVELGSTIVAPYQAFYGAAATKESLDEAGAAFTALVSHLVALAQEEIAVSRLVIAMRKDEQVSTRCKRLC